MHFIMFFVHLQLLTVIVEFLFCIIRSIEEKVNPIILEQKRQQTKSEQKAGMSQQRLGAAKKEIYLLCICFLDVL